MEAHLSLEAVKQGHFLFLLNNKHTPAFLCPKDSYSYANVFFLHRTKTEISCEGHFMLVRSHKLLLKECFVCVSADKILRGKLF